MSETVKIEGVTYEVVARETVEEIQTHAPTFAGHMIRQGAVATMMLRRPKGKRLYMVTEFGPDCRKQYDTPLCVR